MLIVSTGIVSLSMRNNSNLKNKYFFSLREGAASHFMMARWHFKTLKNDLSPTFSEYSEE